MLAYFCARPSNKTPNLKYESVVTKLTEALRGLPRTINDLLTSVFEKFIGLPKAD